ncbi:MAG: hypothetical protein ACKN9V_08555 [Pseudomonadota bacterium]
MNTFILLSLIWALNLHCNHAFSTDQINMVSAELTKTKGDFQSTYNQIKKALRDIEQEQSKAVRESKAQSLKDQEGIKAFNTYDILISSRYVDKDGKYTSSLEVSSKDHENLNELFQLYLRTNPLAGRLSAGHARRYISWAVDRLKELYKYNSDPTEKNNPDLEILARLKVENESRLGTIMELAQRLGVKLEEASALAEMGKDPNQAPDRVPASTKPR